MCQGHCGLWTFSILTLKPYVALHRLNICFTMCCPELKSASSEVATQTPETPELPPPSKEFVERALQRVPTVH